MDNSSYRSQYLEKSLKQEGKRISVSSYEAITMFWRRVAKAEAKIGKTLEEGYDTDDYEFLFNLLKITSPSALGPVKSRIGLYLKDLNKQGLLDQEYVDRLYNIKFSNIDLTIAYDEKFFKDFDALQFEIERAFWISDRIDENVFSMQISCIYMAWCGFHLEEALQLKKADIKDNCIVFGDKVVYPNETIMSRVKSYRDSDGYDSQGRGVIHKKYAKSEWLFRTNRSPHVDSPKTMRIMIRIFGKGGGQDTNMFNYDKIYWSGIYNRAYEYELEHGDIKDFDYETIENIFQEKVSPQSATSRLREYRGFKKFFYKPDKDDPPVNWKDVPPVEDEKEDLKG